MRPGMVLLAGCVFSCAVFAQRGGGHGGGGHAASAGHAGGGFHASGGMSRGYSGGGSVYRGGVGGYRGGAGGYRGGGGIYRGGGYRGYGYGGYRGWGRGWGWYPGFYGYGYYPYWDPFWYGYTDVDPYTTGYYSNSYGSAYPLTGDYGASYDQPPVVINQGFPYQGPPPMVGTPAPPQEAGGPPPNAPPDYSPVLYLIALKDHTVRAVLTYWTDHGILHYVSMQHETKEIPLSSVDRELSERLNRERNLSFHLPPG